MEEEDGIRQKVESRQRSTECGKVEQEQKMQEEEEMEMAAAVRKLEEDAMRDVRDISAKSRAGESRGRGEGHRMRRNL